MFVKLYEKIAFLKAYCCSNITKCFIPYFSFAIFIMSSSCPKYHRREWEAICCPSSIILRTLPLMLTTRKKGRQETTALKMRSLYGTNKSSSIKWPSQAFLWWHYHQMFLRCAIACWGLDLLVRCITDVSMEVTLGNKLSREKKTA